MRIEQRSRARATSRAHTIRTVDCLTKPLRVAAALCLLLAPARASTQSALEYKEAAPTTSVVQPILFSISGGISLGAYQAGVNWGMLEVYRAASSKPAFARDFRVPRVSLGAIAGASAGNINTLLWAIEACTKRAQQPPDSSLFWKVWTSVGMPQLLRADVRADSSERALFDRRFYRDSIFPMLRKRLESPDLQPGCAVRVGVTLTSLRPDTLHLGELPVLTQRFATAFMARVEPGPAGPRMIFAWPDDTARENRRFGKLVLPAARGGRITDTTIFDIVEASSAFPIAFQPKALSLYHPDEKREVSGWFLDGGVFDNNPVSLAVNLFADAHPALPTNQRADSVSVIYVTPGRYRDSLAIVRARKASPMATGGLRAAMQALGGAVETAQQYELQFAVREDPRVQHPDTLQIRLTSRAHPILGEHLSHFGAFLARPFREYDFVVGVYDAMYFVATEYTCRGRTPAAQMQACVADAMATMIRSGQLNVGAVAPPLLGELFAREFRAPGQAALRDAFGTREARMGGALGDTARARVLLALHDALQRTQLSDEPAACGNVPLPHLIVCGDRLGELLDAFATKDVRAMIARWRDECRAEYRGKRKATRPTACQESEEVHRLVRHPTRYASRLLDRLLERAWDVEHAVHLDNQRTPPAGLAKGERLDAELQAAVLMSLYRSRPLRPRYGFSWSPSSVPERARLLRVAVPYQVAFNVGDSGFEMGYRPTWHFSRQLALAVPLTVHWTTPVEHRSDSVLVRDGKDAYVGGGVGLAATGVLPRPIGLFFPEFGVTTQLLGPTSSSWTDGRAVVTEVYGDMSLLAGRLRIALRRAGDADQLFDGGKWAWSVGLSDVNGLLYWLTRLRR